MTALPLSHISVLDLTAHRAGPTRGAPARRLERACHQDRGPGQRRRRRHGQFAPRLRLPEPASQQEGDDAEPQDPEGHAIFMKLAEKADVIVENYRSDVKHRLKVDYDTVAKINPRIVYGSIAGFGQSGPDAARPGVDQIAQGMGGLMSITGEPGRGPMRVGIPIADLTSGLLLAQGMILALYNRERTGKGQWVHTSLIEAQIFMLDFQASRWLIKGEVPKQAGNDHPTGIPTGVFPTADGHINIAASGQNLWQRCAKALGAPELDRPSRASDGTAALAEPQGRERAHRRDHQDQALGLTGCEAMNKAGVPCGPINTIDQTFAEPQVKHLGIARRSSIPSSATSRWSASRSTCPTRRSPRS